MKTENTNQKEVKPIIIGFDTEGNSKYHLAGKKKLATLTEAIYLTETYCKIDDQDQFVKVGFSNYLFQQIILSEPQEKREMINKSSYFQMYNLTLAGERLDELNSVYNSIATPMLSDYSNYDLNKDFNIYLKDARQIENYKKLEWLVEFANCPTNQRLVHKNLFSQAFNGFIVHRNGKFEISIYNTKNL